MTRLIASREGAPVDELPSEVADPLRESSDLPGAENVQASIALFCGLVAAGIAGIGYLARSGFGGNSPLFWAKFVGLSWFLLTFSLLVRTLRSVRDAQGPWRSWAGHASLSLVGLGLTALFGFDAGPALSRAIPVVFVAVGCAGFLLACWRVARNARLRDVAAIVVFAGVFAIYGACVSCGNGYQNPLFVEGISFRFCQIDELYHASICNILRTYGVASTGLDGVPFQPYHFGSHWLFARLCNLLDVRVIDFYSRGYRVLFVPFGVFCLGIFAVALAEARSLSTGSTGDDANRAMVRRSWTAGALFWFIVLTAYVSFMPYPATGTPIYAWSSIIISESYAVAVALSLLGLAWAISFFQGVGTRPLRGSVPTVAAVACVALLMAALSMLKVSQSAILVAAVVFFFVRLAWHRSVLLSACSVAAAVGGYCLLRFSVNPHLREMTRSFLPFEFVRSSVEPELWPYFWLFYYAWLWIVAAVRIRQERIRTLGDLLSALRGRRLLDLEFLFVVAVAGAGTAFFLVPYSSAHYFGEYQQWLAVGVLLSIVVCRSNSRRDPFAESQRSDRATPSGGRWAAWRSVTLARVFLVAVMLSVAGMDLFNTFRLAAGMVNDNAFCRGHAGGGTGVNSAIAHGHFREAGRILDRTAADVERRIESEKNVLTLLRSIDEMPLSEKRASLLFIPKSNRQFWELLHGPFWPLDGPLVAPALGGVAMIDGLCDRTPDTRWYWYSYDLYPQPELSRRQPPLAQYLPVLRSRCARMGFKHLIVIDTGPDGLSRQQTYDCLP
jgi:hypothetical protein